MAFIKEYFNQIKLFLRDEDEMNNFDFAVYAFILFSMVFLIWKFQSPLCLIETTFEKVIRLLWIGIRFMLISTLVYNLYYVIKNRIK